MMKSLLSTAAVAALAAGVLLPAAAQAEETPRLYFQINPNFNTQGSRQLFLFGQAGVTGTVVGTNGFNQAFTLNSDGFALIDIAVSNELANNVTENKGFQVLSAANVSGYLLNRRTASTDMAYLIDANQLGTNHVVAGYQNISADQISVQAVRDGTEVTFTRPGNFTPITVTLNAGQTYMFSQSAELTGTRVTSNLPVAVFSGNQCANVPTNNTACDHLLEQIPSVDKLSSSYLLAQTPRTGSVGNVFRAIATQDNTQVSYNGTVVATLNAGQFFEGRVVGGNELTATAPIMVAQYLIGTTQAGEVTDPAMVIVPGSDQWLKSYVFSTPSGGADFPTDFISLIIPTADLSTLRLDGVVPDISGFQQLRSTLFSFGNIDVSAFNGVFSVEAANPFLLLLSGFAQADSYLTYGGAAFSPGASPPPPPPPPPPGGIRLHWDGLGPANNSIVEGGNGTWTVASTNFTDAGGVENGINSPQPSTVVFGGTAGTVTVSNADGPVTITGMTFTVDGYEITGDAITLAGAPNVFTLGGAGIGATISAQLRGTGGLVLAGDGSLLLTSALNDFTGGITINGGTLRGVLGAFGLNDIINNGNLILDVGANGTLANGIGGSGIITKLGAGILTINTALNFSGEFLVNAGGLNVVSPGILPALVRLNGTTLTGNGSIGGFVAGAGSSIAPGAGIATLTSTGNGSFMSGSTYQVEVTSTGQSDRIAIDGTVNIASGTTLSFTKTDSPRFVLGTRYTVLTTTGGRTGSFATLSGPTRVSRFISVVQETDANNIYLGVRQTSSFASAARTPNQIAAATGADNAGNGALYTAIAYLDTDAQAQAAFDQVSGELHPSVRGATVQDTRFVREALSSHMQALDDTRKGLWMSAYGSWGTTDSDGNAAEMKRDIAGFFMGFDALRGDNYAFGVMAGYGSATINVVDRGAGRATSDDIHIGAYGGFRTGKLIASVGLSHVWRNLDTRRTVTIPGFTDTLTASYQAEVTQFFGEAALSLPAGKLAIEPFVQLAYADVTTDPIAEVGGAARLTSARVSDGYLISTLGGRIKYGLPVGNGSFGITAEAAYRHFGGGRETTPIIFNLQAGQGFGVQGVPIGRDVAALGLVVSGQLAKGVQVDFGYRGHVGNGVKDHGVRGGVVINF